MSSSTESALVPTSTHIKRMDAWELEFVDLDKTKFGALLHKMGIPFQIVEVMIDLWDSTQKVAGKVYNIGKVIACKIIEFVQRNPNMAFGMALGAAASLLTFMIPWVGPLLAPLVAAIAIPYAGIVGFMSDLKNRGESTDSTVQAVIAATKEFFRLLIETFKAIKELF